MQQVLAVGIGGFFGAIARYLISGYLQRRYPGFTPAGTLAVNVIGCFAIGFLMALCIAKQAGYLQTGVFAALATERARALLITGFLGGLTTFSAFGYETAELMRENALPLALTNIAANVCLGLIAVWLGSLAAEFVVR